MVQKASPAEKERSPQAALVCGQAFQRLAERLFPSIWAVRGTPLHAISDEMGDVVACATNLGLAIELYLKGLLARRGLEVPKVHDLAALFDALPEPERTYIEILFMDQMPDTLRILNGRSWSFTLAKGAEETPQWDQSYRSLALPDLLARSKDLFQSWRYVFEFSLPAGNSYQFHQFEFIPLRCAAEAIRVELVAQLMESGDMPVPDLPPAES
jgi:hypothetical protein